VEIFLFFQIIEETPPVMEGEGKVKYNFKAESPRELSLQKVCTFFF
jgi:hypothetical protein